MNHRIDTQGMGELSCFETIDIARLHTEAVLNQTASNWAVECVVIPLFPLLSGSRNYYHLAQRLVMP